MYVNKKLNLVSDDFLVYFFHEGYGIWAILGQNPAGKLALIS